MGETLLGTLTKLQFVEVPPSTCLETIRRSPSLRFLTVEGLVNEGDEGDEGDHGQLVQIPQPLTDEKKMIMGDRLEDLRLNKIQKNDYSNPHAVEQVLSRLELPQLRSALLNLESEFDVQHIVTFFVRSSPPLTDLTLMFDCDNDPDAIELFHEVANHLPCLTTLSLEFNVSGSFHDEVETVIQFLSDSGTPRSDEPSYSPPFPLLQSLTYVVDYERDTWGGWKFIPTLFPVALANGAPPSLRPLRKFSTDGTLQPSKKILRKLMAVHRAGIDFYELNDKLRNPVANDHYHGTRTGSGFWEMSP
ncbi:hypothetical protein CPC08DRAFT_803288 [Agrocybe pediades]|nr:hypothetical protein CPC08DRAFT_803288 [Agrocybe pediades]